MYIHPTDFEALLIAVTGDYAKSVFLKQDNYVAAHMTQTEEKGKATFSRDWWCNYLIQELAMNLDVLRRGETVNMFVGDALHHSWVMHYQITLVRGSDSYTVKRVN